MAAESHWGQGCTGGWGGEKGGGPQGAWKPAGRGRPGRPLWTLATREGEGQATFFVDAGILTSDFPCSAWGRGLANWREQRSWAGRGPEPALSWDVSGQRPKAGELFPCPWAWAAGGQPSIVQLSHPGSALRESHGGWLQTLKIASTRAGIRVIISLGQSPSFRPRPSPRAPEQWGCRGQLAPRLSSVKLILLSLGPGTEIPLPGFLSCSPRGLGALGPPTREPQRASRCECGMETWPLVGTRLRISRQARSTSECGVRPTAQATPREASPAPCPRCSFLLPRETKHIHRPMGAGATSRCLGLFPGGNRGQASSSPGECEPVT